MTRVSDTSWLTPHPVNPMNVGQYVNNENSRFSCNVFYHEVDIPTSFPLELLKFLPNINYEGSATDGERDLRVVALIAVRDIGEGEELFSSYITVVNDNPEDENYEPVVEKLKTGSSTS